MYVLRSDPKLMCCKLKIDQAKYTHSKWKLLKQADKLFEILDAQSNANQINT